MHCKHCGKQIANDSKFCSFCGGNVESIESLDHPKQETKQNLSSKKDESSKTDIKDEQIINPKTVKKIEGLLGIGLSKKVIGIYLVWFLIHLVLLLIYWNSEDSFTRQYFWPFSKYSTIESYHFTEFFFYTIIPILILVIINLFKQPKISFIDKFKKIRFNV